MKSKVSRNLEKKLNHTFLYNFLGLATLQTRQFLGNSSLGYLGAWTSPWRRVRKNRKFFGCTVEEKQLFWEAKKNSWNHIAILRK
jgi:hypothetical protein